MPLKLNVGASRKVSDGNYGSRGAMVNLELELESGLVKEPNKLQERIRQLFALVRVALKEELTNGKPQPPTLANGQQRQTSNGQAVTEPSSPPSSKTSSQATQAQVKAIYALARQQGLDIQALLLERCKVQRLDELTLRQASALIDDLKNPQSKRAD